MILKQASDVLKNAEAELRKLVAIAASEGDYGSVIALTEAAKGVSELECGLESTIVPERASRQALRENSQRAPVEVGTSMDERESKSSEYPRFVKMRDELVKIGWSKREQQEYLHKAPKIVVDLLVTRIEIRAASGKLFTTDDIFPLENGSGDIVPSYQAYLTLAWLREESLVVQDGRKGYRLPTNVNLRTEVDRCWKQLQNGSE